MGLGRVFLILGLVLWIWPAADAQPAHAAEPSEKLKSVQKAAAAFYQAGSYREALQASKQALALTIEEFGPMSEQASIQAYGAGLTAEAAGDFAGAESLYDQSLRIREIVYGPESAGVAAALERLAMLFLKPAGLQKPKRFSCAS